MTKVLALGLPWSTLVYLDLPWSLKEFERTEVLDPGQNSAVPSFSRGELLEYIVLATNISTYQSCIVIHHHLMNLVTSNNLI
jgi:hypothetical protein